jgi:hypothetical protein
MSKKKQEDIEQIKDVSAEKQDQVSANRKQFQDLITTAKGLDFKADCLYVACPELGEKARIKLTTMKMIDVRKMQEFELLFPDISHWEAHFMFCAKDADDEYLFQGEDGLRFIQSKGNKWYLRYGLPTLELNGFMESYKAEKK